MLDPDPRASAPTLSRRRLLLDSSRGLLALALVGTAATACGKSEPPAPDPLEAQLEAARRDADLATAAAKTAKPADAAALREIAAQRNRHAAALVEELARAAGKPTPTEAAETADAEATGATAAPSKPPAGPPSVREVTDALKSSADSAAKLVPTLSGYRAGLMGSIAASCTTSYLVGLPSREKKPQ